ncbi:MULTISPECIES: DUF4178 domain-containing protein [Spirosoma]|uniref:DUF4178 domain-containing protein n=1 Tax=Spirosoma sordidisoli TaxID=2502893 RepID=A0A4Q2ULV9_9BACT|nr:MULTISPECIES: DUF4178 domain-containing protein [Spirosoma]RYC68691.1 DUF4178 domain-containing protein [Spirosoma sordidisoli]
MTESAPTTPPLATLTCPNCQTSITYYDVTGSSFYACPACATLFEYEHEGPPRIIHTLQKLSTQPLIPIGATGTLGGNAYRVVGFMRKTEAGAAAEWSEYVLYSPVVGYAQLAEYNGHWQFVRPAPRNDYTILKESARSWTVNDDDRDYQLYHHYQPRLLAAVGEFDWNIREDEALTVYEFIAPPYMLSSEQKNEQEASWYRAEHRSRQAIADAFGLDNELPQPLGVGAIQPSPTEGLLAPLVSLTIGACLAVLLIMLIFNGFRSSPTLIEQSFFSQRDSTKGNALREFISPSFAVEGPTALAVQMNTTLTNQWVELAVRLVNDQTGDAYEFAKSIEYYSGVSGGESWTEGRQSESAVLSRVPSGRYHLEVQPYAENAMPAPVRITVKQNTTLHSNIFLILAALLIYPIVSYIQQASFEQRRWAESDYGAMDD